MLFAVHWNPYKAKEKFAKIALLTKIEFFTFWKIVALLRTKLTVAMDSLIPN